MRVLHNIGDSFLDFVEENQYGSWIFKAARLALFAMVLMAGGKVASGQFLSFQWDEVLFIGCGVIGAILIAWRWELAIIVVLGTTAFIFHYRAIPTLSLYHFIPELKWLEDFRLFLGQGIILYVLGLFFLSRHVSSFRARISTPLTTAILTFLIAATVAGVIGVVFNDIRLQQMIEASRPYSYYLLFFVTLLCLRSKADLKIVMVAVLVMTVIVAIGMALQFASGNSIRIFVGEIRVESMVGRFATRVLPPGQALVWLLIPPLVAVVPQMRGAQRVWVVLALWVTAIGLLLTLTRAMWMGCLAGILLMLVASSRTERVGMVRIFMVFAGLVMFLLLALGAISTSSENYMSAYIQRFTSIFTSDAYVASSTVGSRMDEIRAAWDSIVVHPWQGIGIGAAYRYELQWSLDTYSFEWHGVAYIHNVYILVLTKMGLLGLVPLLVMLVVYFARAWKIYKMLPEGIDRALVMGAMGSTLSCVIASNLQPSLASPEPVSVLAFMWGATEFLRWWHESGRVNSEWSKQKWLR